MAASDMNWPLSGDVSQWINPTWWLGSFGQQLGFINVNQVNSGDPQLERRIIQEVGSYGRQLGWVTEALDTVVSCIGDAGLTEKLSDEQRRALDRLSQLVDRIERIKAGESGRPSNGQDGLEARVARLEDELRSLTAAGVRPGADMPRRGA
jgi:hypothetical protein